MPKEKQKSDMVNAGFTVQRELLERFRELYEYKGESVSDTLHELIGQWVTKVESMKIGLTRTSLINGSNPAFS